MADRINNDGGLAVVRIKPLGAGRGGCEKSAFKDGAISAISWTGTCIRVVTDKGRASTFDYPEHVISPNEDQSQAYDKFMASRVEAFLNGINVNIMCYGQTGSGKTHTMFGPPSMMAEASRGKYGQEVHENYGLCPRGIIDIMKRLEKMKEDVSMRYEITASAVEIRFMQGNRDMLSSHKTKSSRRGWQSSSNVVISTSTKPPIVYGTTEMPLDGMAFLLKLFRCISTRSTKITQLNDSSSRSHCFVYLNLYAYDIKSKTLRRSRFQFVDLAGSERMKDAHGSKDYRAGGMDALQGLCVNYGLILLSQRIRTLVAAKRKSRKARIQQSCKTQGDPDEILLLAESLSGDASSLVIVCVSSASDNATQSINALDLGSEFAKLSVSPRIVEGRLVEKWIREANKLIAEGSCKLAYGTSRYALIRQAKRRAGEQLKDILGRMSLLDTTT